jgi:RimJ/RimL family protein N-acetyltransferase
MAGYFQSKRLIYRAIGNNDEDRTFIFEHIYNDPELVSQFERFLFTPQPKKYAAEITQHLSEKAHLGVMICLQPESSEAESNTKEQQQNGTVNSNSEPKPKAAATPIGIVFLDEASSHKQHRDLNLGIAIIKEYQGKGYGSEAINWAVDWGFLMAGLHRVTISCFSYNTGAARLYERLGFVKEGVKREFMWFNGSWHNGIMMSMLEDEWRILRKRKS